MPGNFNPPIINRPIKKFSGSAIVIGCSQNHCYCNQELHPSPNHFYSIDIDGFNKADLVSDIRAPLPVGFDKRFDFILVEYLLGDTYNDPRGFDNIWNMTKNDGFIVILGCSKERGNRDIICQRGLKHVEFTSSHGSILIPKNQNLSIEELNQAIARLPQHLRECLKQVPQTELDSTLVPIETYYGAREEVQNNNCEEVGTEAKSQNPMEKQEEKVEKVEKEENRIHRSAFSRLTFGIFKRSKNLPKEQHPEDMDAGIKGSKTDPHKG